MDDVDDIRRGDKICHSDITHADFTVCVPFLTYYQAEALLNRYPGSYFVNRFGNGGSLEMISVIQEDMKKVMRALYVHKSNIDELLNNIPNDIARRIKYITNNFDKQYEIIKYDPATGNISLIDSPDWNEANEPTVGDSYTYKPDGSVVYRKGGSQVYHNKWQFVSPDYNGFDVEKAKQRTKDWNSIPDINQHKIRIGNKKYWHEYLKKNGLEI